MNAIKSLFIAIFIFILASIATVLMVAAGEVDDSEGLYQ